MKRALTQAGKIVLFFTPMILGVIGLRGLAGEPVQDALFSCVSMYVLNYGDTPPNLLVELARWLAPLTTASGIVMALRAIRDRAHGLLRYLMGDGVAVYGPEAERARLVERLGRRGLEGTDRLLCARQYILLGDSRDSFALCRRILDTYTKADVFLQCAGIPPQAAGSPRLHLFSPAETAARLFWKECFLYPCSLQHQHRLNIVLLGFGSLGETLLYYGLLDNIFDPGQRLTYHIFGGSPRFSAVHPQLDQIGDPVIFHEEPWWDCLELLCQSQLVLLLPQQGQAATAWELLQTVSGPRIVIFAQDPAAALLSEAAGLELFPWMDMALEPDYILQDALLVQAQKINLHYAQRYHGEQDWHKLDAFTRYSNISCADYHDIRLKMLAAMGLPADAAQLAPEHIELLAELEHIRWCRYHYLNNWRFGMPDNGRRKDPAARLHMDLIPYGALDEEAKEKDRNNVRGLLSISN